MGPSQWVPVFVVTVERRSVRRRSPAINLQIGFVANERADVDGVVRRREIGQLSEIELFLERRRKAAVVLRTRALGVRLGGRRKAGKDRRIDVDVARRERLVRALE